MIKPLEYYFAKKGIIEHVIFNKYTIDVWGIVRNKKTGEVMTYHKIKAGYNKCSVYSDMGKRFGILVGRAIASTFLGQLPTLAHTADHKDKNRGNDIIDNIRWLDKSGQKYNQDTSKTLKTAFIIIRDDEEKTANGWVEHLKKYKNPFGHEYTESMVRKYARQKQHGFSYKKYQDLPEEVWKRVNNSETSQGRWEISNMNRVKYVANFAENVLSDERLGLSNGGYPKVCINGKNWLCHVLSFMVFFPEDYANKKPDEIILHEDDDKIDFRPHKLHLGTRAMNTVDAYDNGKYDNTKSERMKCASYINGVLEKEHDSQEDAARYLKSIGMTKASQGEISKALSSLEKIIKRYGRTWKKI